VIEFATFYLDIEIGRTLFDARRPLKKELLGAIASPTVFEIPIYRCRLTSLDMG
jgi:hypothetical protein